MMELGVFEVGRVLEAKADVDGSDEGDGFELR